MEQLPPELQGWPPKQVSKGAHLKLGWMLMPPLVGGACSYLCTKLLSSPMAG